MKYKKLAHCWNSSKTQSKRSHFRGILLTEVSLHWKNIPSKVKDSTLDDLLKDRTRKG